jgi:uncharacterized protein YegP (UPF0339 family)
VAQVFELAELVGRRPVGNIRRLPAGGYRLRFRRHAIMRTAPEVYVSRPAAEAGIVRVRVTYAERSTGELVLGPLKSRAARRIVGIPQSLTPARHDHLSVFVGPEPEALIFPGAKGGPLRRSNFNKMSVWSQAVRTIGAEGLHFHDLRHTGNHFAAASGAGLKDLMARMGHDSERAAIIYQHEAQGADMAITSAIDAHIEAANPGQRQAADRMSRTPSRSANGPLMAHGGQPDANETEDKRGHDR